MDEQTNKFLIPGAIVAAGLVIALAVIYSTNGPAAGGTQNAGKQNAGKTAAISELPAVSSDDFVLGDPKAPVTMIEYGDFQCPFCGRFFKETESVLREKYVKTGKVKFIWRDFAFLGQESAWAANAARCAGEQGKYWEYHDYLFNNQKGENQNVFSKANLKSFAAALSLDRGKFDSCVDGDKYLSVVQAQTKSGGEVGVSGTPANFINGTIYTGALPASNFIQIIDAELNRLGK